MRCFIDGDALCIVRDDFIDLQVSDAIFLKPAQEELKKIMALEKCCIKCGATVIIATSKNKLCYGCEIKELKKRGGLSENTRYKDR